MKIARLNNESISESYNKLYSSDVTKLPRCTITVNWDKNLKKKLQENQTSTLSEILNIKTSEKLRCNSVKLFIDGVVEAETALLEEKYDFNQETKQKGRQMLHTDELNSAVKLLSQRGIQCHFHAVGDKAVRLSLDSIEKSEIFDDKEKNLRHIIAHIQLINQKDIPRFKNLGVIPNFSPFWRCYDKEWKHDQEYLGYERAHNQFQIKSLSESGAKVCFGSDWPVSSYEPLTGIEIAVTRKPIESKGDSFVDDEKISVEDAIKFYTINSAIALNLDETIGSLEVGKRADLVILDRNIIQCNPGEIHKTRVRFVMIDGQVILDSF